MHFLDEIFFVWFEFHWSFVTKGLMDNKWALVQVPGNGLTPNRRQAIIWTNADPAQWRIYAALVGEELN